ncbi:MAG: hypothetical protein JWO93_333 [Micrococcaceae bacterium]|nr:hypothetical protein [Micrococcaceae bacterium]
MTKAVLVESNALKGLKVALSVSRSADIDLARLGLSQSHVQMVLVEVARAVVLAGGTLLYGGSLRPPGYTGDIMQEVRRFADGRQALEICVPASEYQKLEHAELVAIEKRLGISGALRLITPSGEAKSVAELGDPRRPFRESTPEVLTTMRRYVSNASDARIAVGGKLADFAGKEPGVIEEARMSLQASKSLYVAGGYGGASAAMARALGFDDFDWAPPGFPDGGDSEMIKSSLEKLKEAGPRAEDGLTREERRVLAISHRPADIASRLVLGLSRGRTG